MVMSPIDTLIPKLSWEFMGLEDGGKGKKVCLVSYVQKRIGRDHVSRLKQTNNVNDGQWDSYFLYPTDMIFKPHLE